MGPFDKDGYGTTSYKNDCRHAHIVAYLLVNNLECIPNGLLVRHVAGKCSRKCIENDHLSLGTAKENSADKKIQGTYKNGENHSASKISENLAIDIWKSKGTQSQKERCAKFNVTTSTVAHIDNGGSWNHITGIVKKEINRPSRQEVVQYIINDDETRKSIEERFEKYKSKDSTKFPNCNIWIGSKRHHYGQISVKGVSFATHVAAWIFYNKKAITEGLLIRHGHQCSTFCFKAEHLDIGTPKQNAEDRIRDGTNLTGERGPNAKISNNTAALIRESKGDGTGRDRAKRFNVSRSTIYEIDKGKIFKILPKGQVHE